ncbi:MAG: c-type cytochrome [Nevskia sp.]|nr:c-type cytochrome [Nevskia sp.]
MKRVLLALALCAPLYAAADAGAPASAAKDTFVQGDAGAGGAKAAACFACHGPGGNGAINPEWPKLAAQHSSYIYEQLTAFKGGDRKNPVMLGQAAALSDEDMRNLATFFAGQKPVPGVASKDAVAVAEKIYRAGDAARGLPACSACHGPTGAGNAAGQFPRIAGQNAGYSANQLKSYKSGERGAQGKGQMMAAIASKLSDQEIQALASYVSGLQ